MTLREIWHGLRDLNNRVNRTSDFWQEKLQKHPLWMMVLAAFSGVLATSMYPIFVRIFCYDPFATIFSVLWCVIGLGPYLGAVFLVVVLAVWALAWIWWICHKLHLA